MKTQINAQVSITYSTPLEKRIAIEKAIAAQIVNELIEHGFILSINNGGDDFEIDFTNDSSKVIAAMFATDEDTICAINNEKKINQCHVWLVYGNDGYDVISDYSVKLEPYMIKTMNLAADCENI